MTLLEPPRVDSPEESSPRRARTRRLTVIAIVVGAALAVAGGVITAVHALDAAALTRVHVFLDAKPVTCTDPKDVTTVAGGSGFDDDPYRVPAVKGAIGLDCVLSVVIENRSDRDVALQAIRLPFFGPDSSMGVRSDRALTQQSKPSYTNDGLDVVYTWGGNPLSDLGPGDSFTYRIHLTSDGCRQVGSTSVIDAPIATVSTGFATRDADLDGAGFGVLGVRTTAQPCH